MKILPKKIQSKSFILLINLAILSVSILSSCEKDKEEMENRDAFLGQWDVVENEAGITPASVELRDVQEAYIATITRSEVFADEVNIYNFFSMGSSFRIPAFVEGKNISIPKITLDDYDFKGDGTISDDKETIEWTYWVDLGYGDVEYRATYTLRE